MIVGVLALQGGFDAHARTLRQLDVATREVRLAPDLDGLDALILPGGESTTMLKLLDAFALFEPLKAFGDSGRPVLGTCAGAILMVDKVTYKNQRSLGWIPASIERNAYGSQQESFRENVAVPAWGLEQVPVLFIRAPRFIALGEGVSQISASGNDITGVSYGTFTAVTYHPELGGTPAFHRAWLNQMSHRS